MFHGNNLEFFIEFNVFFPVYFFCISLCLHCKFLGGVAKYGSIMFLFISSPLYYFSFPYYTSNSKKVVF